MTQLPLVSHWIDGAERPGTSGRISPVFDPALGIVTKNVPLANSSEIEAAMIGINVPIPVPVAYFSFGGWKNSLFGDTKAQGAEGVHFFTRGKAITSRWLDPSHGGITLGFPQNG